MKRVLSLVVLCACAAQLAACAALPWVPARVETHSGPFINQWSMEDGRHLSLEGPGQVQPGEDVPFTLRMNNGSQALWQGKYCLVLNSKNGPLMQVAGDSFSIQPGVQTDQVLTAHFAKDLPPDVYGLALILPGNMASTTFLHVGNTNNVAGANWPEPKCLK